MNENNSLIKLFFKGDLSLLVTLILFTLSGILLLPYYQFQINPDATVYITIAKAYFSGNIANAVDAYHSPLLSWLLLPFLNFGSNPAYLLLSTKIISLIIGFFTIIGIWQLSYKFEMNNLIRTSILISLIPILLYFAFSVITPDLLMVCILVYYLNIIYSPKYPEKVSYALICGLLGALGYFAKSYVFLFFIIHFILFNFLHYFKNLEYRKKILKNLFLGLIVFFTISGIWIAIISHDEGKITYSTSGEFNHNLVGPDSSKGWTIQYLGDSPVKIEPWSPLDSWYNFKYQLRLIFKNTLQTIDIFSTFSYFSIIILLAYFLIFIKPVRETLKDDRLYPFLTIIIFFAGYTPILLEERYLWFAYILLFLMGGYLINSLFKNKFFTNSRKTLLLLIFIFSFVLMPVSFLYGNLDMDKNIYTLANEIESQQKIYGNVAANNDYNNMIYISYYLNTNYLGQTKNEINNELIENLKRHNIDYYFVWNNSNTDYFPLSQYREVTNGNVKGLRIYSMNEKDTS